MSNRIIINDHMVSLNDYINAERSNRYKAAKIKKDMTWLASFLSGGLSIDPDGMYDVTFYHITPDSKRDPDNLAFRSKFILDGVVKQGKLKGDGRRNIRNIYHCFRTIKGVSIIITRFRCIKK